jgi:oligopeptidase A
LDAQTREALLENAQLPRFSAVAPESIRVAVEEALTRARASLQQLLNEPTTSWQTVAKPLEVLRDRLDNVWSPVRHLHGVADSPALREAYAACLGEVSNFQTELGQNVALFEKLRTMASADGDDDVQDPEPWQQPWLDYHLRAMRLTGAELAPDKRTRLAEISKRLAELQREFSENVMDAAESFRLVIDDDNRLAGLPPDVIANAKKRTTDGRAEFTLDFPVFFAVQSRGKDRSLREAMYRAWSTRASDQSPSPPQFDNSGRMEDILSLRCEAAQLLGFDNPAERSLATKMAASGADVLAFLTDLAARARPFAQAEYNQVRQFALAEDGIETLEPWDVSYYSERLRESALGLDMQALRSYFPVHRVTEGLFAILNRLFGIDVKPLPDADVWHSDVNAYQVNDETGAAIGYFYLDLYARPGKRGGAWMDECRARHHLNNQRQLPVAYLTCNFAPPFGDKPALLTHDEVVTLFHETGHGMHHLLTEVELPSIGGINGVAWDAVELPSQLLENWCWETEALGLISGHIDTDEPISAAVVEKLRGSRSFMAGLQFVRQLEFAIFDMRLHMEFVPGRTGQIASVLDEVRESVAVIIPPDYNRFTHAFTHIFAGGYAAGYYSYKWAEVLASDAFAKFEEEGLFSPAVGRAFRSHVLARGASDDAASLYRAFRGRDPTIDALMRHNGLDTVDEANRG